LKKQLPVYSIEQFKHFSEDASFYANLFIPHVKEHHFTIKPHKHDFYLLLLFTKGHGTHYVDFNSYPIKPGTVFMLSPGQVHSWKLSDDIDGYVFFHSKTFYDEGYTNEKITNYPFFNSINNAPFVTIKKTNLPPIEKLFQEILQEYKQPNLLQLNKLHALVNILYIELARVYITGEKVENPKYLHAIKKLDNLIDINFKEIKFPTEYASLMNITERHLNRITKTCLNKTPTELISDRVILEAKRMLIHSNHTVSEVAEELGYFDASYFSRLFKKKCGKTPVQFANSVSAKPTRSKNKKV